MMKSTTTSHRDTDERTTYYSVTQLYAAQGSKKH